MVKRVSGSPPNGANAKRTRDEERWAAYLSDIEARGKDLGTSAYLLQLVQDGVPITVRPKVYELIAKITTKRIDEYKTMPPVTVGFYIAVLHYIFK